MAFNINVANALTLTLTNLNATLVRRGKENKIVNYLTFSKKSDEDINNFITKLEKTFAVNKVANNRKYLVVINCLKGIVANFYDRLVGITNWNTARKNINT